MASTVSVKDSMTSRCSVWRMFFLKDWRGYDIIEFLSLEEEEQCCHLALKSYKTRVGIFLMSTDSKWLESHWAGRQGHLGYRQAKGPASIHCLMLELSNGAFPVWETPKFEWLFIADIAITSDFHTHCVCTQTSCQWRQFATDQRGWELKETVAEAVI